MSDPATHLAALDRPLRIVVTGGREYADAYRVGWALDGLHRKYGIERLAHGAARGADTLADRWARVRGGIEVAPYRVTPADWKRIGKRAGPIRNRAMLDAEAPDLVVAFPGGDGTADCVSAARERGIRVWEVKP